MRGLLIILSIGFLVWCIIMGIDAYIRASDTIGIAHEAFGEINELRAELNVPKLMWDTELEKLAIEHSQYMDETKELKHSAYPYIENVLRGTDSFPRGSTIVKPWRDSYFHFVNMVNSNTRRGAIGVVGNYATFMAR